MSNINRATNHPEYQYDNGGLLAFLYIAIMIAVAVVGAILKLDFCFTIVAGMVIAPCIIIPAVIVSCILYCVYVVLKWFFN